MKKMDSIKTKVEKAIGIWELNRLDMIVFLIIVIIRACFYLNCDIALYSDSNSYINFIPFRQRPPLYPIVIDFFQFLMRDYYQWGVVLFQSVLSLVSILFFGISIYRMIVKMSPAYISLNAKGIVNISRIVMVIYGCNPVAFLWDTAILSESLSISVLVMFIYFAIRWLENMEYGFGLATIVTSIVLVFIRQATIVFFLDIGAILVLLLLKKIYRRKEVVMVLCVYLVGIIIFCVYMGLVYRTSGIFTLYAESPRHGLVKTLQYDLYYNYNDAEVVRGLDEIVVMNDNNNYQWGYETTNMAISFLGEHGIDVAKFNHDCIFSNPKLFLAGLGSTMIENMSTAFSRYNTWNYRFPLSEALTSVLCLVYEVLIIKVVIAALVMLISAIVIWYRQQECPYQLLGLSGGVVSSYISTTIGTYSEWGRTMISLLPFYYIIVPILAFMLFAFALKRER